VNIPSRRSKQRRRIERALIAYFTIRWLVRVFWRGVRASVA
jgi:hypothetical protein